MATIYVEVSPVRSERDDLTTPQPAPAVDVALHVCLHAVEHAGLLRGHLYENLAPAQPAVALHLEDADVRAGGIVNVEQRLVGREGQAVGAVEVVHHQLQRAIFRPETVDSLERQFLGLPRAQQAIRGIGKADATVGTPDHHVVGAVEALALVGIGQGGPVAAGLQAADAPAPLLAGDQPAFEVEGQTVGAAGNLRMAGIDGVAAGEVKRGYL